MRGPWGVFQSNEGASVCERGVHRFYAQSQQDGAAASAYLNDYKIRIAELETDAILAHRDLSPSKRERLFTMIYTSIANSFAPCPVDDPDGLRLSALFNAREALDVVNFVDGAL